MHTPRALSKWNSGNWLCCVQWISQEIEIWKWSINQFETNVCIIHYLFYHTCISKISLFIIWYSNFCNFFLKTMLFYDSNTANSNILVVSKFSWIQYITKSVNRITTWTALVPSPLSVKVSVIADAFLTSASESDFNKALQQAKTCFKSQKNTHFAV